MSLEITQIVYNVIRVRRVRRVRRVLCINFSPSNCIGVWRNSICMTEEAGEEAASKDERKEERK